MSICLDGRHAKDKMWKNQRTHISALQIRIVKLG